MHYLWSFGAIIFGFCAVAYTFQIVRIFGHLGWAEQRLGPGGTYTVWKIIGIVLIMLGIYNLFNPLI